MATIVEMINPLTGLPEQVDQLDHTAQEIDDAVGLAPQLSNPNLLDNWYFVNPVNQRGQTSYTGVGYGIDRWFQTNANCLCTITDNGLVFAATSGSSWMKQIIDSPDALFGRKVTVSMLTSDNTLHSITGTLTTESMTSNTGWDSGGNVNVGLYKTANGSAFVQIGNLTGNSITIKAVKLELGSQQTLAHQDADGNWVLNEIPDYSEQLARCQRYFQLYSSADIRPVKAVDCRPMMRTDPSQGTIVIGSTTYYYNTADL